MNDQRLDPHNTVHGEEVPEADLLEQRIPHDPEPLTQGDIEPVIPGGDTVADEADRLEQAAPLPGGDEEDYPHDRSDAGRW